MAAIACADAFKNLIICQPPRSEGRCLVQARAHRNERKQCSRKGRDDVQRHKQQVHQIKQDGKQPKDLSIDQAVPFHTVSVWAPADLLANGAFLNISADAMYGLDNSRHLLLLPE